MRLYLIFAASTQLKRGPLGPAVAMSYYLGKVGRAGARLVHSCRELYNDVNAAYLTGAVDVLVVRQRDGSLKATPFHARFGKLGVLRTGDYKEVGC